MPRPCITAINEFQATAGISSHSKAKAGRRDANLCVAFDHTPAPGSRNSARSKRGGQAMARAKHR